jgi:hypothetical protein
MRRHASRTLSFWRTGRQARSKIRRRISTWATLRSKATNASNTSWAMPVSRPVEKTVRQITSAVAWLIARSSEKASPSRARAASVSSAADTAAVMAGKARFIRIMVSAGSIIARWRRHVAPEETKIESPISGASAFTIRSLFGRMPPGSASTSRARSGRLTTMVDRRE